MRRRPVARVTTGVAVAAVALTSVFAGAAWAPKALTGPAPDPTKEECTDEPGWQDLEGFDSLKECLAEARLALKEAKAASRALWKETRGQ